MLFAGPVLQARIRRQIKWVQTWGQFLGPAYWNRGSTKEGPFLVKSNGIICGLKHHTITSSTDSSFNFLYLIDLNSRKTVSPRK